MSETLVQRAFGAGELAPGLGARADLALYTLALRTCRNFIVRRHGGVWNRPGTRYVATTKLDTDSDCKLYPFRFAAGGGSCVIEAGDEYFRFHQDGEPVRVSGVAAYSGVTAYIPGDVVSQTGVNYYCHTATTGNAPPDTDFWHALEDDILELPTAYPSGAWKDPARSCWSQQGFIITISNLGHVPRELVRESATRWYLRDIVTAPRQDAPTSPTGTAGAAGTRTFQYVITAASVETYEESLVSAVVTIATAADPTEDAPHLVEWVAPTATPAEYYIYGDGGAGNGVFGFLGTAKGDESFRDIGYVPDFGQTPPEARALFNAENAYPALNTVYQQRRVFAGTHTDREAVYASVTGFPHNFSIRSPLQDDDAVTFRLASATLQVATQLLPLKELVLFTDTGAWVLQGDEAGVLRPTAINPRQHGWSGSAFVPPVVIGHTAIFVQARGSVLRDLAFDERVQGYRGRDLSLYASHLFTGYTIDRLAYAEVPDSTVWAVRDDGTLLGLTYILEDDVLGWHRHDTLNGTFEDVCTIDEGDEDAVYVVVRRTIGGTATRTIERFASRQYAALADAFHLDCGLTIENDPAATVIGGLSHLDGATVYALADGIVRGPFLVNGGVITLPVAAATVHVGLRITAQLETLDLDVAGSALRDKRKLVKSLGLLLEASSRGFSVGPDTDHLFPVRAEGWDATTSVTGRVEINATGRFTDHGRMVVQHVDPTPLAVLAVLPHVEVGG